MSNKRLLLLLIKICIVLVAAMFAFIEFYAWKLDPRGSAIIVGISTIICYVSFATVLVTDEIFKNKFVDIGLFVLSLTAVIMYSFAKEIYKHETSGTFLYLIVHPGILFGVFALVYSVIRGINRSSYKLVFNISDMVEIGMMCALALILDLTFFKIRIGQNGGSISLVMFPLAVMSYRKGLIKGFIGCGIVFGFLSCLIDGYGIASYPFDYLAAFGSIGLVGLFKTFKFNERKLVFQEIFLGVFFVIAVAFRLLFATLSGVILWNTKFFASLAYNAGYILPSGGIVIVLLLALYKPINKIFDRKTN